MRLPTDHDSMRHYLRLFAYDLLNYGTGLCSQKLRFYVPYLLLLTTISACSTTTSKVTVSEPLSPPKPVQVSDRPFEMDTLYALLVAEMAGDRRRFDIMLSNYVQQAEITKDIGIIARAARLARYLNTHPIALDMALLWVELEPDNTEARYITTAELVSANRLLEAIPHATFLLENNETSGFDAIGARAQQGGEIAITRQLLSEFDALVKKYPTDQSLLIGISLLLQHTGDLEQALTYTKQAILLSPNDFQAKAQETRILQQLGRTEEALALMGQLVQDHPQNSALRLQYARSLLKTDIALAQQQFETLLDTDPANPDLILTLALIEYERGTLNQAKQHFLQLTDHARHSSAAHFYLGRIELTLKNQQAAISHLSQVQAGTNFLPAQSLISDIYISLHQPETALTIVRNLRKKTAPKHSKQIQGLYQLESYILTTQGQYLEAIEALKQGIDTYPKSSKLLYSRAMLYTRINEISSAEKDLKNVITLEPNDAAALNALGYTLADRTDRIEEAYQYIQRAFVLTPNDPAIMDSLGWVEFRRGNHNAAIEKLRSALKIMPDHEIAAHLGEVLWVTGKTEQAQEVWRNGLSLNPDSPIIHNTMQRLKAAPQE